MVLESSAGRSSGPLASLNAQFSPKGLIQRYAHARIAMLPARIAFMFFVVMIVASCSDTAYILSVLAVYILVEIAEVGYLRKLPTLIEAGLPIQKARVNSAILSAFNALMICGVALVPLFVSLLEGQDQRLLAEPFFALCITMGPMLSASFDYRVHQLSSVVRNVIYGCLPIILMVQLYLAKDNFTTEDRLFIAGMAAFFISQIWFLLYARRRHQTTQRAMRSYALQRQALEDAYQRLFDQKQEARRLAMIAEHANDGVMLIGQDGYIQWVNDGFVRMTGYSSEELVGNKPDDLLSCESTEPGAGQLIIEGRRKGIEFRTELINKRKDGREVWIETNQVPVFDEAGNLEHYIAVERDITAAKEYEQKLKEARNAAEEGARIKEEFLATMSHEFRTPMNGVIGMTQMLQETDLTADQRLYANTILSSSQALLSLINDVLELSRMNAAGVSLFAVDFDLHSCFNEITRLLRGQIGEKKLSLFLTIDPDVPVWVTGDDRRLRQILVNLIGNSIKFTEVGHVTLRVSAVTRGNDVALTMDVEDTGIGIAEDKLERIFDRFSQADTAISRRFGGTGLGLAISRGLARAMGGDITVTSSLGKGACFSLKLPLRKTHEPVTRLNVEPTPVTPSDTLDLGSLRLLVAEDNGVNRLLISKFLDGTSVTPIFALNGREAIDLTASEKPQLILMDISMPEVNGLDATRSIRAMGDIQQPFIAALTANVDEESRNACLAAGMDAFLTKPLSRKDLLRLLHEFSEKVQISADM